MAKKGLSLSIGLITDQKKLATGLVEVLEELSALYHSLEDEQDKEQVKRVYEKLADLIEVE